VRIANVSGRLALVKSQTYLDVATASRGRFAAEPQAVYEQWTEFRTWADAIGNDVSARFEPLSGDAVLGPPVPSPRQVFGIGLNYRAHAEESKLAIPADPLVFTKFPTCIVGPHDSVKLPPGSVDWEVELVVVIGERCERLAAEDAWSHVAGVMVGQDLSERQMQLQGPAPQFSLGKSYPGFGPTGPELVTVDELRDPDDLELGCALEGGEVLQKSRTSDLIFPVPELIARLSAVCPLLPGDLIFTGTPSGVGMGRSPKKFLAAGDVLVTWLEGVGELRNAMVVAPELALAAGGKS
jgi:2,4-diketo-3-deoxy-L-fuconate hydrolase